MAMSVKIESIAEPTKSAAASVVSTTAQSAAVKNGGRRRMSLAPSRVGARSARAG